MINPMLSAALSSLLRWALTFLAGWFVQHGIWTGNEAAAYVGGLTLALLTLGWSLWLKYHDRLILMMALISPKGTTENDVKADIKAGEVVPSVTTPPNTVPGVPAPPKTNKGTQ